MDSDFNVKSLREIYEEGCRRHGCKVNSELVNLFPNVSGVFDLIESIDLSTNFVGPKGLIPFLEAVKYCTKLTSLVLSDNQITNQAVHDCVDLLIRHPSLTKLDFSNNPISLTGGRSLLNLVQNNSRIRSVTLENTSVNDQVQRTIQGQCVKNIQFQNREQLKSWTLSSVPEEVRDDPETRGARTMNVQTALEILCSAPRSLHPCILDKNPIDDLIKGCATLHAKFQDPQFPLHQESISPIPNSQYNVHSWRRITQVSRSPNLFVDPEIVSIDNLKLGVMEESWLLAAWSEAAFHSKTPNPFKDRIYPTSINPHGCYSVSFFIDGRWRYVIIDDFIPCNVDGVPVFLQPRHGNEVWNLILEKAYAKLLGCYQMLDHNRKLLPKELPRGAARDTTKNEELRALIISSKNHSAAIDPRASPLTAMLDLTSGVAESRDLNHKDFDPLVTWAFLSQASLQGALIVATCDDERKEEKVALGLKPNHSYTLRKALEINGVKLVKLRSPWAEGLTWKGEWGVGSRMWEEFPDITTEVVLNDSKDAEAFWMSYVQFIEYFCTLSVCRLLSRYEFAQFSDKWEGISAGGNPTFETQWCHNPHYHIRVPEDCDCVIYLTLPDVRFSESRAVEAIGVHVFEGPLYPLLFSKSNCISKSGYFFTDNLVHNVHLPKGEYWIVPSTYTPNQCSSFFLRIHGSVMFTATPSPIASAWLLSPIEVQCADSGIYMDGEFNPQIALSLPFNKAHQFDDDAQFSEVTIFMKADEKPELNVGLAICKANHVLGDSSGRLIGALPEHDVLAKSPYVKGSVTQLSCRLESGTYNVIVFATPPGSSTSVKLDVWSTNFNARVSEVKMWNRKVLYSSWECAGEYMSAYGHPQFEFIPHNPAKVVITCRVIRCHQPSVAFWVIDNSSSPGRCIKEVEERYTVAKGEFSRCDTLTQCFEIRQPRSSYIILPCLQPRGIKGRLALSVSVSNGDFELRELTNAI